MGRWYTCAECGEELYSVVSHDLGSNHFCESCYEKTKLYKLANRLEKYTSKLPFCDPSEDIELYREQLNVQDGIYDMFYHDFKSKQKNRGW